MTWFTTHLALEGMIAFILIGTELRTKFLHSNATKALFLFANTFAIIPDLDVYLGILIGTRMHRGPSHSIFFPLSFVAIGLIILLYNKQKVKKEGNALADKEKLFSTGSNDKWNQILYLLPYVFFLAAFFWGMHIVLDQDAAEGGMMMFWPLDDRLYEIQLVFTLDANPFLILPWRPLGASFQVTQSTIIGLYNYLFNWTPQDFINAYGTTIFAYTFVGLVLHVMIFICYMFFVLRPMWPLQGKRFPISSRVRDFFYSIASYWHFTPKEILIPGIIITIIGFSFGPLITPQVSDGQQSFTSNINLTPTTINAMSFISIDSIDQPLDPNAQFLITISYNANNFQSGDQLYFIVASTNYFSYLQQNLGPLFNSINSTNAPENDTNFKLNYGAIVNTSLELYHPNYSKVISGNEPTKTSNFSIASNQRYGVGFLLKNWSSKQFWNETNTQLVINGNINLFYTRYVNYWLGIAIELTGLFMTCVALILPFKTLRKNTSK